MTRWELLYISSVNDGFKLNIPDEVEMLVAYDAIDGWRVKWYLEAANGYAVISNSDLDIDGLISMQDSKLLDDCHNIRPVQNVRDNVSFDFEKGNEIAFLASREMISGEDKLVLLLSVGQLLEHIQFDDELFI